MNEELREKVLSRLAIFTEGKPADETADAILALFASSLVKAQREAYVAGMDEMVYPTCQEDIEWAKERASQEYPDA